MNEEGHRQALDELRRSRLGLDPVADIRAYTELSFGMGLHLVAIGGQRRFGHHLEQHQGYARWLRERGAPDVADALIELEQMRNSRWYGRQGDGEAARRQDELLDALAAWALA